jgi:hypothetical protein
VIQVDPTALAAAAPRIADVLAELMGGDPAHPPLGADPASAGPAARRSTAGASLVAVIGEQALGLAATAGATAQRLDDVRGPGRVQQVGSGKLGVRDLIALTGWAPPSPTIPPDIARHWPRRRPCPTRR